MPPYFFPPLWEQRRCCIANALFEHQAQSVLELGCGEGNILAFLTAPSDNDEHPITHIYGIDIDKSALDLARKRLEPTPQDSKDLRVDELHIELYHGDAVANVLGSVNTDAIVCSEVIEHIHAEQVPQLTKAIFAGYHPRLAIVTTPNAEFNVNFPSLGYGTPGAQFRNDDHKFEWTRAEFASWANECARTYGYDIKIQGVGLGMRNAEEGFVDCGGCTQMAIFVRNDLSSLPSASSSASASASSSASSSANSTDMFSLLASIDYPIYSSRPLDGHRLLKMVLRLAGLVANSQGTFALESLWRLLEIKQQFKRRRHLLSWLSSCREISTLPADQSSNRLVRYKVNQLL